MIKRSRLEIIKDFLFIIRENKNSIKMTPLLRKTNLSSQRFSQYFQELKEKEFIEEKKDKKGKKHISLTEKGERYLEKYKNIIGFIDEFEL